MKFDDDDVVSVEEVKHKSQYETILHKVLQKENKKKRREERFASIDWQKKRLPKLSWYVQSAFVGEKKSVMKRDILLEKLTHMGYSSVDIDSDLKRLTSIKTSWLTQWRGWIKKTSNFDINSVCDSLLK